MLFKFLWIFLMNILFLFIVVVGIGYNCFFGLFCRIIFFVFVSKFFNFVIVMFFFFILM